MRESIPTVVAYLDLAVFDAHGENGGRLVSGCAQCHAGADAEACAVARPIDPVAFDSAAGEIKFLNYDLRFRSGLDCDDFDIGLD